MLQNFWRLLHDSHILKGKILRWRYCYRLRDCINAINFWQIGNQRLEFCRKVGK